MAMRIVNWEVERTGKDLETLKLGQEMEELEMQPFKTLPNAAWRSQQRNVGTLA